MNKPRDYDDLARVDRTHISLYTDPAVLQDELERIFYRSWVYVAHESELPNPGDYKTTFIGLVPVIVSRDMAGKVHVLVNRCMHRGATVCPTEKATSRALPAPTTAGNSGSTARWRRSPCRAATTRASSTRNR